MVTGVRIIVGVIGRHIWKDKPFAHVSTLRNIFCFAHASEKFSKDAEEPHTGWHMLVALRDGRCPPPLLAWS